MTKTKNNYAYPVDMSACERMTATESPAHVGPLRHSTDFIVPEGTPVKAACDGMVAEVKDDSDVGGPEQRFDLLGNYIEIKHQDDEYSEYEHLRKGGALVKTR